MKDLDVAGQMAKYVFPNSGTRSSQRQIQKGTQKDLKQKQFGPSSLPCIPVVLVASSMEPKSFDRELCLRIADLIDSGWSVRSIVRSKEKQVGGHPAPRHELEINSF